MLRIDGRGLLTSYVYDAASRLIGQQYQDGTRATMTYDADSRRTVLSDWTGIYTSAYDGWPPQLRREPGGDRDHVQLRRSRPACLDGTADRDVHLRVRPRRADQQPDKPRGPGDELVVRREQPRNRAAPANGVRVSNIYDNADRLLLLANLGTGGTTLSSFAYTYNPAGNRTQVVEVDGSVVTWSYDPTYQLTNEQRSGPNSYNITYAYDAAWQSDATGERVVRRRTRTTRRRVVDEPDQRGRDNLHVRWRRKSIFIRGT